MPPNPRDLPRLLRTVAHLRPSQVLHRLRYAGRAALDRRRGPALDAAYARRAAHLPPAFFAHPGLARVAGLRAGRLDAEASLRVARDALAGRFTFLGRTRAFGKEVAWHDPELEAGTRLWKTLLHEFSYAVDLARAARATGDEAFRRRLLELFASWEAASPLHRPGAAHDAWDARAVATRLAHLATAGSLLGLAADDPDAAPLGRSLAVHALYLRENLEWDLRANHLLRDAVGLAFADALFGGFPEGLALLRDQLDEQLLADGCHFERAPLYHAIALQDLLEVRALLGSAAPAWLADAVARMAGFLAYLLPEDGRLPLFGDTWLGEVDAPRLLAEAGDAAVAPAPGVPERASGLVVLRRGPLHLVVRAGAHAPDYQMGHVHADGLSFELSCGRAKLVTDTGTLTYDPGPERARVRGTAAHNTVQLDGAEQLECWGSFRVGRRGRGRVRGHGAHGDWAWLWATHDGWRFLPGRPRHHRLLLASPRGALVLDAVTGGGRHRVRSALHLHPESAEGGGGRLRVAALAGLAASAPAPLHEAFNATREMTELYVDADAALPWFGGWALRTGDSGGAGPSWEADLREEEGVARVRIRGADDGEGIEVRWDPGAGEAAEGVRFAPSRPPGFC